MTVPRLFVSSQPALDSDSDIVVVAAVQTDGTPTLLADPSLEFISEQLAALAVTGAPDEVVRVAALVGTMRSIAIVGLGRKVTADSLRHAAGSAVRQLTGVNTLAFAIPVQTALEVEAVLEGAALGGYSYTDYRHSSLAATKLPALRLTVHTEVEAPSAVSRAEAIGEAISLVKDLVNMPPLDLYPASLAAQAVDAVAGLPIDVTVWDEEQLVAEGFGGIAGVGQGSTRPPRLVKLSYAPESATKHLALVGKGITFDTGGLSLKPPASMVGMKYDMTGAATVLAVAATAARLNLPVRITAWMCIAENMPSGSAIRPNDVLRMRGGRTVEVLNTDAEGRLVLADGIVAAGEEAPDAIVDVATLTGAAVVALGNRYYAAMGDNDLVAQLLSASKSVGEPAWPMPFPAELRATLNSDVADISNAKIGSTAGGMLLAGVFLKEFVAPNIPWAHVDIAGPAQNSGSPWGFTGVGPTGVSVRALIRLAEDFSRP
ncbi:leucyl aminopeptidase [Cryobacterium psychrophilum]|uniref:Probable cytosol aminopeptidase n=1 Tax=Cryobacterium psychrophilum TaxID=41988 RepID=A0A4Y8KR42_9MICO|nr:leucyl aminopeptidase [Cryobacterium psychrophilum]TDW28472.1 leucyl aminopeptidase [Cryobacterium psychrophilum]TFD80522.1 leucyl aminopeptidase [Cryobacterium psychrophilum]